MPFWWSPVRFYCRTHAKQWIRAAQLFHRLWGRDDQRRATPRRPLTPGLQELVRIIRISENGYKREDLATT